MNRFPPSGPADNKHVWNSNEKRNYWKIKFLPSICLPATRFAVAFNVAFVSVGAYKPLAYCGSEAAA